LITIFHFLLFFYRYGFVEFTTRDAAQNMVSNRGTNELHMIYNKRIDVKFCVKKSAVVPGVRQKKPCFNWAKGTCRNGDGCQYSHDGPEGTAPLRKKNPCFNWAKGTCRNGDQCQYSHDAPQGSGPTSVAQVKVGGAALPYSGGYGGNGSSGTGGASMYSGGYGGSGSGGNYTIPHKTTGSNREKMAFVRTFGPKITDETASTAADDLLKSALPGVKFAPSAIPSSAPVEVAPSSEPSSAPPSSSFVPPTAVPPPQVAAPMMPSSAPQVASLPPVAPPEPPAPMYKAKIAKKASIFKKKTKAGKKVKKTDNSELFEM
jgi:hypothetical protein